MKIKKTAKTYKKKTDKTYKKKTVKKRKKTVKLKLKRNAERGPNQRRVKPPSNKDFIYFDDCIDDFEDCIDDSDGTSSSVDDTADQTNVEDEIVCNDNLVADGTGVVAVDQDNSEKVNLEEIVDKVHICSFCLGDDSDDGVNEIIYCDECGISVHEGCYSMKDSGSSSDSSCSKKPWFCETCIAGVQNPTCELCPNLGGIFKETDCGKWVHLVCAFYMRDVTFGEPTTLSGVKLFEKESPQWDSKSCDLCKDPRFMSTGLTIPCVAEMCQSNFHVTCAQQEGSLSDARNLESDPEHQEWNFYKYIHGHCELHVDKIKAEKGKKNWEILQLRTKQMNLSREKQYSEKSATRQRNHQILEKLQSNYCQIKKKIGKPESTFESKVPIPIKISVSALRALCLKSSEMDQNVSQSSMSLVEAAEENINLPGDIPKDGHIPPHAICEMDQSVSQSSMTSGEAVEENINLPDDIPNDGHIPPPAICYMYQDVSQLSMTSGEAVEEKLNLPGDIPNDGHIPPPAICSAFVDYIHARNSIITDLKIQQTNLTDQKNKLYEEQIIAQEKYNEASSSNEMQKQTCSELKDIILMYQSLINICNPNAKLPNIDTLLTYEWHKDNYSNNVVPLGSNHKCELCDNSNHEHLLVKCDTCNLYFHLRCINPDLPKIPMQTQLFGWQCSKCDNSKSNSELELVGPVGLSSQKQNTPSGVSNNDLPLRSINKCALCDRSNDQHLLAKCDLCYLYYHLGCLNPPLTRMPIKPEIFGWQCNMCDKSDSNFELESVDLNAPGKLKYGSRGQSISDSSISSSVMNDYATSLQEQNTPSGVSNNVVPLGSNNKCELCDRSNDQHLLTKCDTCNLYYHLGCIIPEALPRIPMETQIFGWQCSKCDNSKSNVEPESIGPVGLSLQEQNTPSGVSKGKKHVRHTKKILTKPKSGKCKYMHHEENNTLKSEPKRKITKRNEKVTPTRD